MHVNRGLLGWGVFFIVAGSIPLLVQAGVLDPEVVRQVWQLWPLILIGIGLGLILQRTRAAIIGGLIVVGDVRDPRRRLVRRRVLAGDRARRRAAWAAATPGTPFPTQRGTLSPVASVALDISCGDATITSAPGDAWTVDGTSDDGDAADDHGRRRPARRVAARLGHQLRPERRLAGHAADRRVRAPRPVRPTRAPSTRDARPDARPEPVGVGQRRQRHHRHGRGRRASTTLDISANAGSLSLTLPAPDGTINGSISANAGLDRAVRARRRRRCGSRRRPASGRTTSATAG